MWHTWERRGMCTGFWWESPEGRRPLGRPSHRWKDGITMDLMETGWEGGGVQQIQLAQDTGQWWHLVNKVTNLQVLAPCS
jgi:hypothetical protein